MEEDWVVEVLLCNLWPREGKAEDVGQRETNLRKGLYILKKILIFISEILLCFRNILYYVSREIHPPPLSERGGGGRMTIIRIPCLRV